MDPIVSCAEQALVRSPHPALKLSELLESVSETLDRTLDARRLRALLEGYPDRFRVLEPWKGRWGSPGPLGSGDDGGMEAWVVSITQPDGPPDGDSPLMINLRESVRWLARGIDARSATEVSRWYAIAMSERAVRSALTRPAA